VGDVLASCDARLELTAPVVTQHFGELAEASKGIAIAFDLRSQHWRIDATFAFSEPSLPIGFGQFSDTMILEVKKVAFETAAIHSLFLMSYGLPPFDLLSIQYARGHGKRGTSRFERVGIGQKDKRGFVKNSHTLSLVLA
jgi:hypothetical protein